MSGSGELTTHTEALLARQEWSPAALHVRLGAQQVASRAEAHQWRRLIERVPEDQRTAGAWPHALAWLAYRADDLPLLAFALAQRPGAYPAVEAYQASLNGDWQQTLSWAEAALAEPSTSLLDRGLAARFRACALTELGAVHWQDAFDAARRHLKGRDRGVLNLDFAYYLIRAGQEAAARDVLAEAVSELRHDACLLTLALADLGITCLRQNLFAEAERSLRRAIKVGYTPEGRMYLSTAWRGLGGLYLRQGQPARAHYAYEMAQAKADMPDDRSKAMRSSALVARLRGQLNDAMTLLHDVLHHDRVQGGQPHPAYADLAAVLVLAGDRAGAQAALERVPSGSIEDAWRAGVVRAELQRLDGQDARTDLNALNISAAWARQEAWVFPKLFASIGVVSPLPEWEAVVYMVGPLRVTMNGVDILLNAHRPAAALLALLVVNRGRVSAERALDALTLPGQTPRAQHKELSRTVRELWEALGWRGAVTFGGGVVCLSDEVNWRSVLPAPSQSETFCEGRYDRWILEWRDEQSKLNIFALD
ncbi:hypothetical protein [Deinococcus sp.]|uniref:hypothetical protein n=1 Tax=Deinococcus sp. TaxID=47478 RepID=UPI003B5AA3BD